MTSPAQGTALFQKQDRIFPKRVKGVFRNVKWLVMAILLVIYYGTPWLRWDRGLNVPDQAVLIDIPHARAYFFGIEIWPQEVYFITGLLILAAIALFFITSLFGRVWCGYACPQTVWTDLYVWVERLVQGDRTARMRLASAPWSFKKLTKLSLTHGLWLLIALLTGGAWVFYFNDAPTLWNHIFHFDMPWSVLSWVLSLTGATYLMAGFAREQVCTYMCPYARFQSAMFDKNSLIIGYDPLRGEPRGKHKKGTSWEGRGHCVDCTACVQVCPMGIDIRDGLQMECIACGLCIDACDQIMDRLDLPKNLIRYDTENDQNLRVTGEGQATKLMRPRSFFYMSILTLVGGLMVYGLLNKSLVEVHIIKDRSPLFIKLSDGSIRNGYVLKILNKTQDTRSFRLSVRGIQNATLKIQGSGQLSPSNLPVFANSTGHFRVFVTSPKPDGKRQPLWFHVVSGSKATAGKDIKLEELGQSSRSTFISAH